MSIPCINKKYYKLCCILSFFRWYKNLHEISVLNFYPPWPSVSINFLFTVHSLALFILMKWHNCLNNIRSLIYIVCVAGVVFCAGDMSNKVCILVNKLFFAGQWECDVGEVFIMLTNSYYHLSVRSRTFIVDLRW